MLCVFATGFAAAFDAALAFDAVGFWFVVFASATFALLVLSVFDATLSTVAWREASLFLVGACTTTVLAAVVFAVPATGVFAFVAALGGAVFCVFVAIGATRVCTTLGFVCANVDAAFVFVGTLFGAI